MTDRPSDEPTNLVLEQLRVIRAEMNARFGEINARFAEVHAQLDDIRADIKGVKASIRGFQHQTIAEIYKANLTVSAFADLNRRVPTLEEKAGI